MMNKFKNYFLEKFNSRNPDIKKKAHILYYMTLLGCITIFIIALLEIVNGFPFSTYAIYFIGIIFLIILLFTLRLGKYAFTSTTMLIGILCLLNIALIIDKYNNPFDMYRYSFVVVLIIFLSSALSSSQRQVLIICFIGIISMTFFYLYRYGYQHNTLFDKLSLISFFVCVTLFLFYGIIAFFSIRFLKQMNNEILAREKEITLERDESLRILGIIEVYTKPSLISNILNGENPTTKTPVKQGVAILFCDIRDFTKISENKDPLDVVEMLNPYFTVMNTVIIENSGEIDKLMGDCIMAIFHNCDDALNAAIAMRKALGTFSDQEIKIRNGIGIHYGDAILGNIGSPWKMDNTVIGDVVNLASRLESLTKVYRTGIIISEEVKDKLTHAPECLLELDKIAVKGRGKPEKIYGIYDNYSLIIYEDYTPFSKDLRFGLELCEKEQYSDAIDVYEGIKKDIESMLTDISVENHLLILVDFFIERSKYIEKLKKDGKISSWNYSYEFHQR